MINRISKDNSVSRRWHRVVANNLRREPEIVLVFYQQALRVERLVVPRRIRFVVSTRRYFKMRARRAAV